jgi:hypothetical protein
MAGAVALAGFSVRLSAADLPNPVEKAGPKKSGFYTFWNADREFGLGLGTFQNQSCTPIQGGVYAGNLLLDCDAEVPHNETSIATNPNDPAHAVGAFHTYHLTGTGNKLHATIQSTPSFTLDGGATWHHLTPPITPYQFSGDPAVAFDLTGRIYLASIADHEGDGGSNYTGPSVVVQYSDDGGSVWTNPVTVASGKGSVDKNSGGQLIFQDKDYIAVDQSSTSPRKNRAYVTWTSFHEFFSPKKVLFGSPIMVSTSDDGRHWSPGAEISGSSPDCVAPTVGPCSFNQFSSPTVAPGGKVYVAFENFNTPAENQYLVVSSTDGGRTWSAPSRAGTIYDINFKPNGFGDDTLTGCAFRVAAPGNAAADPSDPSGDTVYVAWADNRNGNATNTNTDVILARSTDGGATWTEHVIDNSSNDQFYAWVAVANDGRVDVGYMDRSYSAGQSVCQYGFSLTRLRFDAAGGIASSTKTRVDTGLSDPGHSRWFSAATGGNSLFIGDYNGITTGSDGKTWSLWTDQRALVANPPTTSRNHAQHAVGATTP